MAPGGAGGAGCCLGPYQGRSRWLVPVILTSLAYRNPTQAEPNCLDWSGAFTRGPKQSCVDPPTGMRLACVRQMCMQAKPRQAWSMGPASRQSHSLVCGYVVTHSQTYTP